MKAHWKSRSGRIMVEVEATTQKELFREIAQLYEVFELDEACGLCNSTALRLNVRTHDDNDYFEWSCTGCGAQMSFGQHKNMKTLFAKRGDGKRGWKKWQRDGGGGDYQPPMDDEAQY